MARSLDPLYAAIAAQCMRRDAIYTGVCIYCATSLEHVGGQVLQRFAARRAAPKAGMSLRPRVTTVLIVSAVSFEVRGAPPCVPPLPFSPWQTTQVVV